MRCKVENCNSNFNERQMFESPSNSRLLKKWKEVLKTDENYFYVCEKHFKKNDFVIIKRLKAETIPSFYLSNDEIKIEKDACGVCLSKQNEKLSPLTKDMQILVYDLSGYEALHDQICEECENELNQYQQIKSTIQQKHEQLKSLFKKSTVNTEKKIQNFPSSSEPTNYSCSYCSTFHTSNEFNFYNHLKSFHSFGCDYCNTNVATFNQLKAHLDLTHADKPSLTCNECNAKGFIQMSFLNTHQRVLHSKQINLKCFDCPKTFLTVQDLHLHKLFRHPPKVQKPLQQLPLKIVAAETIKEFTDEDFEKKTLTKVRKKVTPQRPIPSNIYQNKKIIVQKTNLKRIIHEIKPPVSLRNTVPVRTLPHRPIQTKIQISNKPDSEPSKLLPYKPAASVLTQKLIEAKLAFSKNKITKFTKLPTNVEKLLENETVTSTVQSTTEVEQVNFVECDSLKMEPEEEANLESSDICESSEFENIAFKEEEKETEYEIQVVVSEDEEMISVDEEIISVDEEMIIFDEEIISEDEEMSSKNDVQKFLKYEPLEKFDKNSSLVKCLECNKFLTVEDLLTHRKTEHPKHEDLREYELIPKLPQPRKSYVRQKPPELKIACEFCFNLMSETSLEKHIENYHSNKTKEFLCHICSKDFVKKPRYEAHMRRHDPDQMFKCDLCNSSYDSRVHIKRHIERIHLGIYLHHGQCNVCNQKIFRKENVEKHMTKYHKNGYDCGARVNSETNWFDCEKCGASYQDLFTYRRHDCEKGRYQIRCPDCMRPIKTMERLKIHQANNCGIVVKNSYGSYTYKTRYKKV